MTLRTGMGETGESYLVGPDKRLRSDSFLDPEKHSTSASFDGSIENNGVDTDAVREALAGRTGRRIITDYNNNRVFSAYTPLKVGDVTWAAISEINVEEALSEINTIKWLIRISFIMAVMACMIIIYLMTKTGEKLSRD